MHSPKLVLYTLVLQISTDIHDIVDIVDIHYSGRVWLGLGRVVARVEAERAAARGARAARVASLLVGGRRVSAHPRGGRVHGSVGSSPLSQHERPLTWPTVGSRWPWTMYSTVSLATTILFSRAASDISERLAFLCARRARSR